MDDTCEYVIGTYIPCILYLVPTYLVPSTYIHIIGTYISSTYIPSTYTHIIGTYIPSIQMQGWLGMF